MMAAAQYLCQVSGMQEAAAPLSCNWFYLRCEIGSRKKTHQKKKNKNQKGLLEHRERMQLRPATLGRRHAGGPFRAVCKSTVKFHFSNAFNQKRGNKASW